MEKIFTSLYMVGNVLKCPNCGEELEQDMDGISCPRCGSMISDYCVDDENNIYLVWAIKELRLQKIGKLKIEVQE